jgi:hypothetical protein
MLSQVEAFIGLSAECGLKVCPIAAFGRRLLTSQDEVNLIY